MKNLIHQEISFYIADLEKDSAWLFTHDYQSVAKRFETTIGELEAFLAVLEKDGYGNGTRVAHQVARKIYWMNKEMITEILNILHDQVYGSTV